ncbi:MAG: ATP-binding protein [Cyanobacteria bacterium J06560_2]
MTTADDIFDQSFDNITQLGLTEIPFTESPVDMESATLQRVFTGREGELRQVFNLLHSRERRRILVYGHIGIGKSAFLLEVLSVLRRKVPTMLTTYISLPENLDLATASLIAVAREMEDDEWAQQQLNQMGIPTAQALKARNSEAGVTTPLFSAKVGAKDVSITKPQYPTVSLDTLLERAQEKYPRGVVIAIDDLDKQNPSVVRQMMHNAQGMLKGRAWFILTGHPIGMPSDLLTSERGLFDLQLELKELDQPTTYKMLINYLSSARLDNDCTDPEDPRCVFPFLPETAKRFCEASLGKPRLFNRLGSTVLATAADREATCITPDVLDEGLAKMVPTLRQKAALTVQEEKVRLLLQRRGALSDETISMEDLQSLGVRSFSEIVHILERLESADLAHQVRQDDVKAFEPIPLPPASDESSES